MDTLIEKLCGVLGKENVLSEPDELLVYECDGLPQHKYRPRAVVFPSSTAEVSQVMRLLARERVPFTPRGAGTGLSGGALALTQGVVIELARMRRILKLDEVNRLAVVQPGVVNSHVSRAVAHLSLHYVPDPSSQPTCTIGGNIAENAGGIHCLKYGTTTDHVLGIRVVLAGGDVVDLGGAGLESPGYDLLGVFVGSEGTFGIATEATLRLVPTPPAIRTMLADFLLVDDASHAVSAIIAAGVMPAALEMMDREIIRAVEASVFAAGLPTDVGAALLIELDGIEAGIDEEAERVKRICLDHGARSCRMAHDENERKKLWAARKGAFGAIGRISPDSMIQDAVVPRSQLPEVLGAAYSIAAKYQLKIANVFHAGDGNLHPLICFDSRSPQQVHNVKEAGRELMETCVRAGGSITGEHGVGFDKRELLPLIFSENDMGAMLRVRAAFDPLGLCNPGKIIPVLRGCGEANAALVDKRASGNNQQRARLADLQSLIVEPAPAALKPAQQTSATTLQTELTSAVGDRNVNTDSEVTFSVAPGSISEVQEVVKIAATAGWKILPAGAIAAISPAFTTRDHTLVVSTRRLNRIIEHEPADLIAVAEAGTTLQDFNHTLSERGQWLPLDPPGNDAEQTLGGVIANGIGGAQQLGYGPPRRHVIGMKVVMADGTLIKAGGKVVKNVAGYDMCKLFTGSRGSLGVIVEINFKLRPLPKNTATVITSGSIEELFDYAKRIQDSRLFPVAMEVVSPSLSTYMNNNSHDHHTLAVRFAGSQTAVAAQTQAAMRIINSTTAQISSDSFWERLSRCVSQSETDAEWRASVRISDAVSFLTRLEENLSGNLMWHAGAGDGRITGTTPFTQVDKLRRRAEQFGGTFVLENTLPEYPMRITGNAAVIMQRIKRQLDPNAVFCDGPFAFETGEQS